MILILQAWGPAAIWAAVLFLLSEVEPDPESRWLLVNDKVAHLGLYLVLGTTLAWGRWRSRRGPTWLLLCLGLLYGALDEWHQGFVPGRDPSTVDLLADAVGLILGFFLAHRAMETLSGSWNESPPP